MEIPFKKLGLAITFSPTGKALLKEAKRLCDLFNSEIILIHVGERTTETERKLIDLVESTGFDLSSVKIEWEKGDVAEAILRKTKENKVELLIAGALEKENFITYYIGSVARKIMREAPSSVLILTQPSELPTAFKKFCISVDFTQQGEETIKTAYNFAMLEKAEQFILIREFQVPGLAITVHDTGSIREVEESRKKWEKEEKDKMDILVKEMNLTEMKVETICLYGKEGFEANKYVEKINGDIYVVPSPQKKLRILDRIFQHDIEFLFKQIPCPLLLIRPVK